MGLPGEACLAPTCGGFNSPPHFFLGSFFASVDRGGYKGGELMEEVMSKKILLLGVVLMFAACGRSGLHEDGYLDIAVGVSSLTGDQITGDKLQTTLDGFDFELVYLATKPDCIKAGPCIWYAEGMVPSGNEKLLRGYRANDLQVVTVTTMDSKVPESNPLAPR